MTRSCRENWLDIHRCVELGKRVPREDKTLDNISRYNSYSKKQGEGGGNTAFMQNQKPVKLKRATLLGGKESAIKDKGYIKKKRIHELVEK